MAARASQQTGDSTTIPTPPEAQRPITASAASAATPARQVEAAVQPLPVVDLERSARPAAQASAAPAQVVAVPVRVVPEAQVDVPAAAAAALVPTEEGGFWHQVVQQLIASEAISALVRELALQAQLVARDNDQWLLRVERESLNTATSRARLQAALQAAGYPVRLVVEVGRVTDNPARRNAAVSARRQQAAERLIREDPFVQAMMRDFGAQIVPGSIRPVEPDAPAADSNS